MTKNETVPIELTTRVPASTYSVCPKEALPSSCSSPAGGSDSCSRKTKLAAFLSHVVIDCMHGSSGASDSFTGWSLDADRRQKRSHQRERRGSRSNCLGLDECSVVPCEAYAGERCPRVDTRSIQCPPPGHNVNGARESGPPVRTAPINNIMRMAARRRGSRAAFSVALMPLRFFEPVVL